MHRLKRKSKTPGYSGGFCVCGRFWAFWLAFANDGPNDWG